MAVTSFFPIGCMKRQHAVILESIWETDLIITRYPAQRTGLLTPLLTCLTFTLYSSSRFYLDKLFSVQLPFSLFLLGQKFSKSNSSSLSLHLDKIILSPTPILQNYSNTILNSVLVAKPIQFCKIILRQF